MLLAIFYRMLSVHERLYLLNTKIYFNTHVNTILGQPVLIVNYVCRNNYSCFSLIMALNSAILHVQYLITGHTRFKK